MIHSDNKRGCTGRGRAEPMTREQVGTDNEKDQKDNLDTDSSLDSAQMGGRRSHNRDEWRDVARMQNGVQTVSRAAHEQMAQAVRLGCVEVVVDVGIMRSSALQVEPEPSDHRHDERDREVRALTAVRSRRESCDRSPLRHSPSSNYARGAKDGSITPRRKRGNVEHHTEVVDRAISLCRCRRTRALDRFAGARSARGIQGLGRDPAGAGPWGIAARRTALVAGKQVTRCRVRKVLEPDPRLPSSRPGGITS